MGLHIWIVGLIGSFLERLVRRGQEERAGESVLIQRPDRDALTPHRRGLQEDGPPPALGHGLPPHCSKDPRSHSLLWL